ncbi:Translation initiation factor 1A (eIF-1A) [Carpediemonas membranifera]|uniref:Eukaryotic translation initiation factor 4C n=1 Tax=Carpediemonas membranifera TaxID=201153 RepID=A0A8J6B2P9_9EUKA|nr:Translation initiation factor 1A (eIF-1A) [Carpediemonas membranifera]|eukprot:KAG9391649.1 Translation initiation factor 1A (eIF-1A) [Carpediemonas membranifera]
MAGKKGGQAKNRQKSKKHDQGSRDLEFKEDSQEYAQVLKMLGNGRLEAFCLDGKKRQCHIRGKLRKKEWINVGDIVLIALRDFQDEKADVIIRYKPDEARALRKYGEIPAEFQQAMEQAMAEREGEELGVVPNDEYGIEFADEEEPSDIDDI